MSKSVLYAEDEPDDIFFMKRAFRQAGVGEQLRTVNDGNEAIEYLAGRGKYANRQENPLPGVVLLDLKMPETSGFEVLQWIRTHPGVATIPVVIFTSSSQAADIERASKLGANGYLVKPGSPDLLIEVVKAFKDYWLKHDCLPGRTKED